MKRYILAALFMLLYSICGLLSAPHSDARDKNILRVESMGSIPVSTDTAEPDNLAIDDAFRRGVAKAVETIIPEGALDSIMLTLEEKIYSSARRYILNYRVISKEIIEDEIPMAEGGIPVYSISIEADIAMDLLIKDMTAAGILREGESKTITLNILNLRSYKAFEFFKKRLQTLRGVKEIRYNLFARNKIVLTLEITKDIKSLADEIMSMDISGLEKEVSATSGWFSAEKIEVKFILPHEEAIQ
jgi:hypothetical protein